MYENSVRYLKEEKPMTTENGAENGGVENTNVNAETSQESSGVAESENAKQLEELEKIRKGQDAKIQELLKEREAFNKQREAAELASKSTEEQMKHFQDKLNEYERERALSDALAGTGISVAQAKDILTGGDITQQAEQLKGLVSAMAENKSKDALEGFKKEHLDNVASGAPATNENTESEVDIKARNAALGIY